MNKSIAHTTKSVSADPQDPVCIMGGDKVPVDAGRQHLIIHYPDAAILLDDCEKSEELRQARIEMALVMRGIARITGEVDLTAEKSPTDSESSPDKPKPNNGPQDIGLAEATLSQNMISEAQMADNYKAVPMSDDEIHREFGPQTTQEVRPITHEDHLLAAENLRKNYRLNRAERAFCAGLVLYFKKLTPEKRQKEIMELEPRLRIMLVLYTADEIRGEQEREKAEKIQGKARDEKGDVIIIGRKFVKAVIFA